MPKRKDQKNTLTNLAELQNDPGRARGQDFKVNNENHKRNKYAAKDKGKSELTGKGAPEPNRAPVKQVRGSSGTFQNQKRLQQVGEYPRFQQLFFLGLKSFSFKSIWIACRFVKIGMD